MKELLNRAYGEEILAMGNFQKFCLRWNNHSSNFVGNLGSLLVSEEYSDVTVCCQGEVWHLHQLVLSAASSHFAQLLRLIPPGQTPILILDGPPACDIQALVHFIYHGEVNVDQESLPSLLRTAASFRIKGLADVSTLTGELKEETALSPQELYSSAAPIEALSSSCVLPNDLFDNSSPLNLSCNRNHDQEENVGQTDGKRKNSRSSNEFCEDSKLMEVSHADSSNVMYHPSPSKKIRVVEPSTVPEVSSVALIDQNVESRIRGAPFVRTHSKTICHSSRITDEAPLIVMPKTEASTETMTSFPCPGSPNAKEATHYISSNVTFPLPILKMALAPHVAYQPSSTTTTQSSNELSISMQNRGASEFTVVQNIKQISNIRDIATQIPTCYNTLHFSAVQPDTQLPTVVPSSPVQPSACLQTSGTKNSSQNRQEIPNTNSKYKPEIESVKDRTGSNHFTENEINVSIPETTFTHKKFSACTIPQTTSTTKTLHIVKRAYTDSPPSTAATPTYYNVSESINKCSVASEVKKSASSPPVEVIQTSPATNIVNLTPVTVTTFTSTRPNSAFPVNSVVYTATSVDSQLSDTSVISSSSLSSEENNSLASSTPKDQASPYLQSLFQQERTNEAAENNVSSGSQPMTTTTVTTTAEGGVGGNAQGAQRVTINMRTFKEEWRRQLLVDYDSNTNMSICMLCFTTFKSYDGPRKNTYVKHAKRFHPALEDYSDEERGVIISMYEKYHKYDIDMQKEINKSFRTTNNSGAALKRMRVAELGGVQMPPLSTTAAFTDNDKELDDGEQCGNSPSETASDMRESSIEAVVTLVSTESDPPGRIIEVPKRRRSSEKVVTSDSDILINNNNNKTNRNKNDVKVVGESTLTSS